MSHAMKTISFKALTVTSGILGACSIAWASARCELAPGHIGLGRYCPALETASAEVVTVAAVSLPAASAAKAPTTPSGTSVNAKPKSASVQQRSDTPVPQSSSSPSVATAVAAALPTTPTVSTSPTGVEAVAPAFEASGADRTFRAVLGKWAKASGWQFQSEHWAVARDIPVEGQARFEQDDFREAVRALLATTLLGDTPVQPCFYSNKVLRVVATSESCARPKTN